ncbi:MAG: cytochrome C oxidase subunit IV family protein [Byssovorax sp.]
MADKGKKGKGGGDTAKKAAPATEKSSAKAEPVARVSEEIATANDHAHDDHDHAHAGAGHAAVAHAGHAHAAVAHAPGAAHGHKPNIKEYMVIFAVLTALTVLEVVIAQIPGISKKLLAVALVGLAVTKAGIVGLYYMHLKSETRVLKLTVALPLAAPTLYALVLMTEAAWRLTR